MKNYLVRICLLLTVCTLLLTACGTEGTKLPNLSPLGKVVAIAHEEGSGTRAEFDTMLSTKELAQEYMQLNPRAQVSVVVTDSSSGLTSAIRRECDFAISSRELKS